MIAFYICVVFNDDHQVLYYIFVNCFRNVVFIYIPSLWALLTMYVAIPGYLAGSTYFACIVWVFYCKEDQYSDPGLPLS